MILKVQLRFHWKIEEEVSPSTYPYRLDSALHPQPLAEAVPIWSANYSLQELQRVSACVYVYVCVCVCVCVCVPTDANTLQHTLGRTEAAVD